MTGYPRLTNSTGPIGQASWIAPVFALQVAVAKSGLVLPAWDAVHVWFWHFAD